MCFTAIVAAKEQEYLDLERRNGPAQLLNNIQGLEEVLGRREQQVMELSQALQHTQRTADDQISVLMNQSQLAQETLMERTTKQQVTLINKQLFPSS